MRALLTPSDMLGNTPIEPGWALLEIVSYDEQVTKGTPEKPSDGSMNAIYEFKVLEGNTSVMERFSTGTIKRYFNEKALGFGRALWATLFPTVFYKDAKGNWVTGELTTEMLKSGVGKKLRGYLKQDGKYVTIEDYQPVA